MTPPSLPPLPPAAPRPPEGEGSWSANPLEVDRYLDGEGSDFERAARAQDVARSPALAARLESRAAFLRVLAGARATVRPASPLDVTRMRALLDGVLATEAQIEVTNDVGATLGTSRQRLGWRHALGAAAAVLVAVGAWSGLRERAAEAVGHPVEMAARLLDWVPAHGQGPAGCADGAVASPLTFALVMDGELEIRACNDEGARGGPSQALLRRPETLPAMGFVAVPAPGAAPSSEIGITELGRDGVVVFDVLDHGSRVYLALDAAALRLNHAGRGDSWTCAACHGPVRQALPNPHRIVLRRAP